MSEWLDLIEATVDGPVTIGYILSYDWAVKLTALLCMELRDEGRIFYFTLHNDGERGVRHETTSSAGDSGESG